MWKLKLATNYLINDYGHTQWEPAAEPYQHQRFAGSTAIGLNFSLLKSYLEATRGYCWAEPAEDNGHIYVRLLGRKFPLETIARFQERFGKAAFDWANQPIELARACLKEGRHEAALTAYNEAVRRQPNNWVLIGEIARFLTLTLRDYSAGLEMARAGLVLNPICPDLWNTLGDSLFYLDRIDEAHNAFLHALELNPDDVRARYNLIYTLTHRNNYAAALNMIAEGLIQDKTGEYRERFLEKQSEILLIFSRIVSARLSVRLCQRNRERAYD